MTFFDSVPTVFWPVLVLGASTVFTIFWGLDSITHQKLARIDISDREFQVHRNILVVSVLMEASLVLVYWFGYAMLPFFIALFITRTVHEFIDELHFHTERCTPYESYLHLGMWISVLTKTIGLFIWAFIYQYNNLSDLPSILYIWGAIIIILMTYISYREWKH